jgi:hypothetical protein
MAHLALTGDFAMPNRADLMSLQTITQKQDQVVTNKSRFTTMRNTSNNLDTSDIQGKQSDPSAVVSIQIA